jgi:hypothetical protein
MFLSELQSHDLHSHQNALDPCVLFGTLAMVYILIKMCLALHVPFKILVMAYIPFEMHLAPIMVNILIKMHLASP